MSQGETPEWVSLTEAANRLGIHRNTMRQRVRQWSLATRSNPRNLRELLVNWAEVEKHLDGEFVRPNSV